MVGEKERKDRREIESKGVRERKNRSENKSEMV